MASLIEELIAMQSKRQAPQAIQSDIGGMLGMLSQGMNAGQSNLNVASVLNNQVPMAQAAPLPSMDYGRGSGIGASLITSLLGDYMDERKLKKETALEKEFNNSLPKGISEKDRALAMIYDGPTSRIQKLGASIYPDFARLEVQSNATRAGTPGQWFIPKGSKPFKDEYGMTGYQDPEGNIIPNRFAETVNQANMLDPQKRAAVEQATEGVKTRIVEDQTGSSRVMTNAQAMGVPNAIETGNKINNPGNIRPTNQKTGFNNYGNADAGLKAIDDNLRIYGEKHGIDTLAGVISRWSPPEENNTAALIKNASKRLGLDPNKKINLSDPVVRHTISGAIVQQEGPVFNQGPVRGQTPAEKEASVLPSKIAFEDVKQKLAIEEAKQKELNTSYK
jgi:hypothetical protein